MAGTHIRRLKSGKTVRVKNPTRTRSRKTAKVNPRRAGRRLTQSERWAKMEREAPVIVFESKLGKESGRPLGGRQGGGLPGTKAPRVSRAGFTNQSDSSVESTAMANLVQRMYGLTVYTPTAPKKRSTKKSTKKRKK